MKIACIGGGPAGLYFAISMKLRNASHDVTVFERNRQDDTFGWGVVFSDGTLENLRNNDLRSAEAILDNFAHWDDIDVFFNGRKETTTGHGFCGIARLRLLNILQERALELGVRLEFETEIEPDLNDFADYDLIVAADGINSKIRTKFSEHFSPDIDVRANRFVWLGVKKSFDAFTFIFKKTDKGWIWAHAYRFDKDTSTFIVECSADTFEKFGFGAFSQEENSRMCESLFAEYLDGQPLLSNAVHIRGSAWLNFPRVLCKNWRYKNVVLLGDAAHTAHFSIGSGTKLAFEDAIKLAEVLNAKDLPVEEGIELYQGERSLEVLKLQSAARNSTEWFENLDRYVNLEPKQFVYSLLTRSQRVSHENLRLRDPEWLRGLEQWFVSKAPAPPVVKSLAPMFAPFRLRDMVLENRVVVSPMCMYSAKDGLLNDFHLVHYGARAQGGAGLIFTEMTDVCADGRITPGCAGMYAPEHIDAWRRIVDFVHGQTRAKIALQLGHAGPKGATKVGWEGADEPLESGAWPLIGPSPVAWSNTNQIPREMTRADMDDVLAKYVNAARMAEDCGFDMLELHCAHGYLLSAFLTPLMNRRHDDYGGSLENRLRYPLEVFRAIRNAWPEHKPISVRISATDWMGDAGVTATDAVAIARAFVSAGADLIDVSAGQTSPNASPVYGRMFQTPFSDKIRNELGCATMAVGNIYEIDHVNSILAAGRADLVALARPHLIDPYWTMRAAAAQDLEPAIVPQQYLAGYEQLRRNLKRAGSMFEMNV
ncbi:MAG: bifunctional salicylyl-CoA 5-hydroxylase/oxidoreductase [Alphaproteobacteria bacterium]|nr:bifunctional salicylyl-CoA 5-hydroxylase/oxidoreductase [Alphaproteobacteria bacterium]